ncbi:MAG: hypothetical protein AAF840_06760 [Bacteroidota bacterium]
MITSVQAGILDRVFHLLATSPSPEEIMSLHTTPEENSRLEELSKKNKEGTLSLEESYEIQQYLLAEKYVRLAKAHAFAKLNNQAA